VVRTEREGNGVEGRGREWKGVEGSGSEEKGKGTERRRLGNWLELGGVG
jgi:hypothetical protein